MSFNKEKCVDSIKFSNNFRSIEEGSFKETNIRSLVVPKSLTHIGSDACLSCSHLQYVDLSAAKGLKYLYDFTFAGCKQLKHVLLNNGLQYIGKKCFLKCAFEEIVIPSTVTEIGDGAFFCCKNLIHIQIKGNLLKCISNYAFCETKIEKFIGNSTLCRLSNDAFSHCSALKYVDLRECFKYVN